MHVRQCRLRNRYMHRIWETKYSDKLRKTGYKYIYDGNPNSTYIDKKQYGWRTKGHLDLLFPPWTQRTCNRHVFATTDGCSSHLQLVFAILIIYRTHQYFYMYATNLASNLNSQNTQGTSLKTWFNQNERQNISIGKVELCKPPLSLSRLSNTENWSREKETITLEAGVN